MLCCRVVDVHQFPSPLGGAIAQIIVFVEEEDVVIEAVKIEEALAADKETGAG